MVMIFHPRRGLLKLTGFFLSVKMGFAGHSWQDLASGSTKYVPEAHRERKLASDEAARTLYESVNASFARTWNTLRDEMSSRACSRLPSALS